MKSKNSFIKIISLSLVLILTSLSFVYADEYEYNDVNIYLGGQYQKSVALTSDNWIPSYGWMQVDVSGSTLKIRFQGGSWIDTLVNVSNYSIDTITATQSGAYLNSLFVSGYQQFNNVVTANFPEVNLYINISGGNPTPSKLTTPILQIGSNLIYWNSVPNAVSYQILYSSSSSGTNNVVLESAFTGTVYSISNTGYYSVRANGSGNYQNSDNTSYLYCEYVEGESSEPTIVQFFQRVVEGLTNAFNTIKSFLESIGSTFDSLFAWIPEEVRDVFWAVIIIGFVIGLLIK